MLTRLHVLKIRLIHRKRRDTNTRNRWRLVSTILNWSESWLLEVLTSGLCSIATTSISATSIDCKMLFRTSIDLIQSLNMALRYVILEI